MFPNEEFESFEDGRNYIYENVDNSIFDATQNEDDCKFQEYYVVKKS